MTAVRGPVKTTATRKARPPAATKVKRTPTRRASAEAAPSIPNRESPWRARVADLVVQADLAAMGIRDEVREQLATAENAWLAARSRLEAAVGDTEVALDSLRVALGKVLSDVRSASAAADAAIKRGRGTRWGGSGQ